MQSLTKKAQVGDQNVDSCLSVTFGEGENFSLTSKCFYKCYFYTTKNLKVVCATVIKTTMKITFNLLLVFMKVFNFMRF